MRRRIVIIAIAAMLTGCGTASQTFRTSSPVAASGGATVPAPTAAASAGRAGLVSWVDQPATAPPPPLAPVPPPPAYPACRADQIKASAGRGGVGLGNVLSVVMLTNVSSSNCSLSGYPTSLTGVHADGSQHVLSPGHGTQFDQQFAWPANLRNGQSGQLGIGTWDGCPAAQQGQQQAHVQPTTAYSGEVVGLPGGGTVRASASFDTVCGVAVTTFGAPEPPPTLSGTYPGLSAHANLPSRVVAGTVLDYTVTLTNNTDRPVALDPCPIYQESIYAGQPHQHTYRLNCTAVHAIPADGSVTYAMQIPVPDTSTSAAKFSWGISNSAGAYSGTVITIHPKA